MNITPLTRSVRVPATQTPRDPFLALQRDMNQLFEEALRGFGVPVAGRDAGTGLWPSIEVSERDEELRISAEVPGMERDDIELIADRDAIVLRGETKAESEDHTRRVSERCYGRFERRIPLGFEIAPEQVTARFDNGVLTVAVAKPDDATGGGRRIEIGASG